MLLYHWCCPWNSASVLIALSRGRGGAGITQDNGSFLFPGAFYHLFDKNGWCPEARFFRLDHAIPLQRAELIVVVPMSVKKAVQKQAASSSHTEGVSGGGNRRGNVCPARQGGAPRAVRALCPHCAKSQLFSTTCSHRSQGPEFCTLQPLLVHQGFFFFKSDACNGSQGPEFCNPCCFELIMHPSVGGWFSGVFLG